MEREGFRKAYEEYHELAFHIAFDALYDYELAREVCEEVFAEFYGKMEGLDERRIKGWMIKNVKRKVRGSSRRFFRKKGTSGPEKETGEGLMAEYMVETKDTGRSG